MENISLFGDLANLFRSPQARLRDLESSTGQLESSAHYDHARIAALEKSVSQLTLLSAALWELLKKNSTLSESDLLESVAHLKSTGFGGTIAGTITDPIVYCPQCSHKISPTVSRCIYCGATVTPQSPSS